ncbi:MAG: 2-oxo acid dehydrogenase subunit E2 [Saprospiraceae bacterium]|jgi:pyruvate dehydrogenase E2 component (dihydrolipoamide acetyltransferase)|nr:2-oxo acid dehydrogenase subunit E2 [Saprospiraceae bacterium]MBK7795016.1 2-oxo acid dehydrogenase subunit E2 [Saprospiraceae bacterium]MBK8153484.1 2-oxo acid dehydrogenase subunit E2 [Saprospiraceae bacterium]MBL0262096.1 2-oxo acid dehydrogenase subunit E2 [Saprospiraceae bacterium]
MADIIKMPRLSDTMQEGVIRVWHKKVGDKIAPGDVMAEVETDKATMDLEAFQEGVLLHIAVQQGVVPVDGMIAIIGQAGEDISGLLSGQDSKNKAVAEKEPTSAKQEPVDNIQDLPKAEAPADQRIKASPLAKSIAKEKGIDLNQIHGSGDHGRIVKKDVEEIKPSASAPIVQASSSYNKSGDTDIELSQMRKAIARRLSESKNAAPHFYLTSEVDMDQAVIARTQLNGMQETKISFNDMIVKAVAMALRKNPLVNVSWMGEKMVIHHDIHIGVAVAVEEGLIVPVIRNTDQKSLLQIRDEINDKAERAKTRKLQLEEMQGNTFTISNLGMYDVDQFTAIINPPDACILAVGSIVKKPAVKADQIIVSNRMRLTLSCDHRAVDGALGAKFLQSLKQILENPISLAL